VSVKFKSKRIRNLTANEISIPGINENRHLFKYSWDQTMEGLHPITSEQEIAVNVEVAAVIFADFYTEF